MDKSELRKEAKKIRAGLPVEQYSKIIFDKLKKLDCYKEAKNILIYSSFSSETDTKFLINDKSKNFYLPRINGNNLDICPFISDNNCSVNKYGIKEPLSEAVSNLSVIDIAVVPALAADINGYRLGYGKGYYDRLLPKLNKKCIKIVPIFHELVFNNIPHDKFDIKCNMLITQRNVMFI